MRKFLITVEGKQYEVEVEEVGGVSASQAPKAEQVKVENTAPVKQVSKPVAVAGGEKLLAPMPGMIVTFKVADGATVKKGEVVVVLEAMKMENDITSPADGVFKSVASKGSNVNTGDVIAVIS